MMGSTSTNGGPISRTRRRKGENLDCPPGGGRPGVLAHMLSGVDEPLSDEELSELEELTGAATPGPWVAIIEGPGVAGDRMIQLGLPGDFPPDMHVLHDQQLAPMADLMFIAAARTYMPRLLAELRYRRGHKP
jgi:hypothetical protein